MTARLLAALLLVLATAWVLPAPAYACSCSVATDLEQVQEAEVVFSGTVDRDEVDEKAQLRTLTFTVERVYKGQAEATQVVSTPSSGASCGLEIAGAGPFLVFAEREQEGLTADLCGGTRAGPAPASLGVGQPPPAAPVPNRPDAAPPARQGAWLPVVGFLFAAAAVVVVGLSLIRRRPG